MEIAIRVNNSPGALIMQQEFNATRDRNLDIIIDESYFILEGSPQPDLEEVLKDIEKELQKKRLELYRSSIDRSEVDKLLQSYMLEMLADIVGESSEESQPEPAPESDLELDEVLNQIFQQGELDTANGPEYTGDSLPENPEPDSAPEENSGENGGEESNTGFNQSGNIDIREEESITVRRENPGRFQGFF